MKKALPILFLSFFAINVMSQNVGIGTTTPAASAQLDVSSTTKGFLPPRMTTTQRNAIENPATGLIIFNTTTNILEIRNSSAWISLAPAADALPTIQIGTQKWMNKNLDVAFYRNGSPITQVTDPIAWSNSYNKGAWCYYNFDSTLGSKYGKLYNWFAVNDFRGLCPQGWHVPSDAEWTVLETTLGGSEVAGGKMKEAGMLNWADNFGLGQGNNNSGWTGLPGGFCTGLQVFMEGGYTGAWWSSTQWSGITSYASYRSLSYAGPGLTKDGPLIQKLNGLSVRCLRD